MNHKITLILICFVISSKLSAFEVESDKKKHFALSAVFGFAGHSLLHYATELGTGEKLFYSTFLGTLPGLGKEIIDPVFDKEDLAYDIAGSFTGAVISHFLNTNLNLNLKMDPKKEETALHVGVSF